MENVVNIYVKFTLFKQCLHLWKFKEKNNWSLYRFKNHDIFFLYILGENSFIVIISRIEIPGVVEGRVVSCVGTGVVAAGVFAAGVVAAGVVTAAVVTTAVVGTTTVVGATARKTIKETHVIKSGTIFQSMKWGEQER